MKSAPQIHPLLPCLPDVQSWFIMCAAPEKSALKSGPASGHAAEGHGCLWRPFLAFFPHFVLAAGSERSFSGNFRYNCYTSERNAEIRVLKVLQCGLRVCNIPCQRASDFILITRIFKQPLAVLVLLHSSRLNAYRHKNLSAFLKKLHNVVASIVAYTNISYLWITKWRFEK
jgi:hypothetical protein